MDKIWDEIHSSREWGAYPSEHVIRFFARNYYNAIRSGNEIKVLDFGCGGGAHTWYLAREGFKTYAFDGSKYAVNNAEKKLASEGLNAEFKVGDGLSIDYEEGFFDAILDNVCVYANPIEDIKKMYKRIYSFLKWGGKLLTVCFSDNTYGFGRGTRLEDGTFSDIDEGPLKDRGICHFYNEDEILGILVEIGFKNVQIDKILYTDRGYKVEQLVVQAEK